MKNILTLILVFVFHFVFEAQTTYLWSNGATTSSINVHPAQTTTYYVTITSNGVSYYDSIVVHVNSTPSISGVTSLCKDATAQLSSTVAPAASSPWISSDSSVAIVTSTGLVTGKAPGTATITFTSVDGCQTTHSIAVNPIIIPTFTQVGPYIAGASIAALPSSSTNGITGTWSPTLNNTTTTTYTFTPSIGQCSSPTTMLITINQPLIYTLTASDSSICSGASVTLAVNIPTVNSVTDIDGNTYQTVQIGTQIWMKENLKTTRYANGDNIPNVIVNTQWENLTTGAWAHYNNDSQYENPYGKLYNWYTVSDSRNVCPTGWHVPSDTEWATLIGFLGGDLVAGGKMKSTGTQFWQSPNTDATNTSEFSGLPAGIRVSTGLYYDRGSQGTWWSSTTNTGLDAWVCPLISLDGTAKRRFDVLKVNGISVRCIKN